MSKKLTFNRVIDVDGKNKRYPKDSSLIALFMCPTDDFDINYFIYASCTKSDYSNPALIQVNKDTYVATKQSFSNKGEDLAENLLNNPEEIYAFIQTVSNIAKSEQQTIGDMLGLNATTGEF